MHQGSYIVEVDGIKSLVVTLSALFKVIIHKSRCEVSPVEQDTIECVSTAYLKR
jgi:hypothetical protein